MPLLERVTTLMKANVNDLVDKSENPETLLKQLLLDMQNQFMQVKTQVAIAIAHQHSLEKKEKESREGQQEWVRRATLAVEKNEEPLARVALERSLAHEAAARDFAEQVEEQGHEVNLLKDALNKLEQKMAETKAKADVLVAQHRRSKLVERTGSTATQEMRNDVLLDRMRSRVGDGESLALGLRRLQEDNVDEKLKAMDRASKVDQLLAELKAKRV